MSCVTQVGVDIFLFLSGYGLVFSYKKSGGFEFFKKRILRILPTYLTVFLAWSLSMIVLGVESFGTVIHNFSLIYFFAEGNLTDWFIPAIMALYVCFPIIYKITKHNRLLWVVCICIWFIGLVGSLFVESSHPIYLISRVFIIRIPTFIIGTACADRGLPGGSLNKAFLEIIEILLIGLCGVIWFLEINNYIVYLRLLFLPLTYCTCLLFIKTKTFDVPSNSSYFCKALAYIGGISLELYLLHYRVLIVCDSIFYRFVPSGLAVSVCSNIIAIILSILIAAILSKLIKSLTFTHFVKQTIHKFD